ncbi:hypothetical protein AMJ71_08525 [candidate division TA06 bacterium SM1_40]|uniref:Uncharacterized protein n=2 Tax=Bacteria division TA06 TaxID=1156500 RepID=A0A0S8JGR7_UNCT6|nr:MAG: hypothetical protein AMJ71_08525 [candidate division TA06 bacterium SM1_40]
MSKELMEQLEEIAKAEKLAGDDLEAVKTALKALGGVEKGKIPQGVFSMLASLAGYPYPAKKSEGDDDKPGIEEILNSVDAKVRPQLEAVLKANEAQAKELEEIKKAQAEAAADARRREFLAKAEGFKSLPIAAEDLGAVMQAAAEMGEDQAKRFSEFLTKASEIVAKSALLAELGSSVPGEAKEAGKQIQTKVEEMIKSSGGKLTPEQAEAEVLKTNPDLYDAYMAEKGV